MSYDEHLEREAHRIVRGMKVTNAAGAEAVRELLQTFETVAARPEISDSLRAEFRRNATALRTTLTEWERDALN